MWLAGVVRIAALWMSLLTITSTIGLSVTKAEIAVEWLQAHEGQRCAATILVMSRPRVVKDAPAAIVRPFG